MTSFFHVSCNHHFFLLLRWLKKKILNNNKEFSSAFITLNRIVRSYIYVYIIKFSLFLTDFKSKYKGRQTFGNVHTLKLNKWKLFFFVKWKFHIRCKYWLTFFSPFLTISKSASSVSFRFYCLPFLCHILLLLWWGWYAENLEYFNHNTFSVSTLQ